MQIDSVRTATSVVGIGTVTGFKNPAGKLSFKYTTARDIKSISLRIHGAMQPPGRMGRPLETSYPLLVDGPMPASISKKWTVKLPEGNNGNVSWIELERVVFSDGEIWENRDKLECVANQRVLYRR